VLYTTLHADTAGGIVQQNNHSLWSLPARPNRPRWRSMVSALSSTGVDLSKNEFLEFWVFEGNPRTADSAHVQIVVDLGSVNEDALALAPDSVHVDSTFTGRRYDGLNLLNTEREPTGIFNAEVDDIGILSDRPDTIFSPSGPVLNPALCQRVLSNTVPVYRWGDLGARCTNGNGLLDTEDLNNDNFLNATGTAENVFRWVVDVTDPKYFVPERGIRRRFDRGVEALPNSAPPAGVRAGHTQHQVDSAPAVDRGGRSRPGRLGYRRPLRARPHALPGCSLGPPGRIAYRKHPGGDRGAGWRGRCLYHLHREQRAGVRLAAGCQRIHFQQGRRG
jgi:hypothetical protein